MGSPVDAQKQSGRMSAWGSGVPSLHVNRARVFRFEPGLPTTRLSAELARNTTRAVASGSGDLAEQATQRRAALALTGSAAGDVSGWKAHRGHRFPTMAICASGAHSDAMLDSDAVRNLRNTVRDIVENR